MEYLLISSPALIPLSILVYLKLKSIYKEYRWRISENEWRERYGYKKIKW